MPMHSPKCRAAGVRVNRIEDGAQGRVTRRPLDPLQRLEVMAEHAVAIRLIKLQQPWILQSKTPKPALSASASEL